jgi:AbiV family abortive infection protein
MKNIWKKRFFESLFIGRTYDQTINLIADGIFVLIENAKRLYQDASILTQNYRWTGAKFFLTTANEEMAKAYILLDSCRLDFQRHQSVLKKISDAFYDHTQKHAYMQVIRNANLKNLDEIEEEWSRGVENWEELLDESKERSISYHETYFTREIPLYVDFNHVDQCWSSPVSDLAEYSASMGFGQTWVEDDLRLLQESQKNGFFCTEALTIVNDVFRKFYINQKTELGFVKKLHDKTASQIERKLGIPRALYHGSALNRYPLYHFTTLSY